MGRSRGSTGHVLLRAEDQRGPRSVLRRVRRNQSSMLDVAFRLRLAGVVLAATMPLARRRLVAPLVAAAGAVGLAELVAMSTALPDRGRPLASPRALLRSDDAVDVLAVAASEMRLVTLADVALRRARPMESTRVGRRMVTHRVGVHHVDGTHVTTSTSPGPVEGVAVTGDDGQGPRSAEGDRSRRAVTVRLDGLEIAAERLDEHEAEGWWRTLVTCTTPDGRAVALDHLVGPGATGPGLDPLPDLADVEAAVLSQRLSGPSGGAGRGGPGPGRRSG